MNIDCRLLLVEDDAFIREMLESELTEARFGIVVASSGTQALAELKADATRFKAIITDIKLGGGPDGWTVGRFGREQVPHIPVVYMSGDSAHHWTSKGVPGSIFVAKPFVPAQIITAVSMLLNGMAGALSVRA